MTVSLLLVCTGNVARSVMTGYMLGWLAEAEGFSLRIATAGTLAVEGQPVGGRTQAALATVAELEDVSAGAHRSHQLAAADLARADLVVAMEASHVRHIRRHHPQAAPVTATLRYLCRELEPGPAGLGSRVRALDLAAVDLDDTDDVADPAGGDDRTYAACAAELWTLCQELLTRL